MTAVRPRRIAHVGITTSDLEGFVAFYEDVLGMTVSDRMPYPESSPFHEGVWMRCNSDHHTISVFGLREPSAPATDRSLTGRLHHLAFEMASFDDLRRAARMIRERDLPVQGTRTGGPGCQLRLYFWDPENNLIELFWGLDQVGWDGVARPYPPVEQIDLETLDIESWLEMKGSEFAPGVRQAGGSRS
jgi:catechol 2,3-dioxygenase-like lactoylglutathione lyase family enzyme